MKKILLLVSLLSISIHAQQTLTLLEQMQDSFKNPYSSYNLERHTLEFFNSNQLYNDLMREEQERLMHYYNEVKRVWGGAQSCLSM